MIKSNLPTTSALLLLIFSALTRFYGLGEWAIDGDEFFSYQRGITGDFHPLKFSGIYWLIRWSFILFSPSEFTLRIYSALFGTLSIPLFYIVFRKFFSNRTSLFGAIFVLFSAYHLDHSQLARYYSGVFLFAILTFHSLISFLRENMLRYLLLSAIWICIGVLIHLTFLILPFGICIFCIVNMAIDKFKPLNIFNRQAIKRVVIIGIILGLIILPFCIHNFSNWVDISGTDGEGGWGYSGVTLLLQMLKYFSLPIMFTAIFGVFLLSKYQLDFSLLITSTLLTSIFLYFIASIFVDVRPDYLMAIYPLLFVTSGFFSDSIVKPKKGSHLKSYLICIFTIFLMFPEFISHYAGKKTLNPRRAIQEFIDKNYQPGDKIISFSTSTTFYLKDNYEVQQIGNKFQSNLSEKLDENLGYAQNVWIIIIENRRDMMNRELKDWLLCNSQLTFELKEKRYDFTFRSIRIYKIVPRVQLSKINKQRK